MCGYSRYIACYGARGTGDRAIPAAEKSRVRQQVRHRATRNASRRARASGRKVSASVPVIKRLRRQTQPGPRTARARRSGSRCTAGSSSSSSGAKPRAAAISAAWPGPRRPAAPSAGRCWPARPAVPLGRVGEHHVGAVRAQRGGAGRGVAGAAGGQLGAQPVLHRQRRAVARRSAIGQASADAARPGRRRRRRRQRRVQPGHQRRARGGGGDRVARHGVLQAGQPGGVRAARRASRRLRCAMAVSWAATSRAWPGSSAQTRRSRKRRRPDSALLEQPVHLRGQPDRGDACGHLRLAARRRRRPGGRRGDPAGAVRRRAGADVESRPSGVANRPATAQRRAARGPRRPGRRCAPRAGRGPGPSSEIASSRLVLPLPFGPNSTLICARRAPGQRGIVAEVGERQAEQAQPAGARHRFTTRIGIST